MHGEDVFDGIAAEVHGVEEFIFGKPFGFAFDHDDSFFACDHDDIGIGSFALGICWVSDPLSVDSSDTDAGDGAIPWQVREHERGGCAGNRDDIGFAIRVIADDGGDDLDFVVEAVGEERADGAVDQPACEDFVIGLFSFAPEVVSRNFTGGVRFFDIFACEWEEVLLAAFVWFGACGDDEHGVAGLNEDGSVCLFCDTSVFDGYFVRAQKGGFFDDSSHDKLQKSTENAMGISEVTEAFSAVSKKMSVELHNQQSALSKARFWRMRFVYCTVADEDDSLLRLVIGVLKMHSAARLVRQNTKNYLRRPSWAIRSR